MEKKLNRLNKIKRFKYHCDSDSSEDEEYRNPDPLLRGFLKGTQKRNYEVFKNNKNRAIIKDPISLKTWINSFMEIDNSVMENIIDNLPFHSDTEVVCRNLRGVIILLLPCLEIKIKNLPKEHNLYRIKDWKTPYKTTKKYYFKCYGSECNVKFNKECSRYIKITDKISIRIATISMECVSLWKLQHAASKISKFARRIRLKTGWNNNFFTEEDKKDNNITKSPIIISSKQPIPELIDDDFQLTSSRGRSLSFEEMEEERIPLKDFYINNLIEYFLKDIPINQQNPRGVLMFGLPGSGKNHLLMKRRRRNHLIIDTDDCLAMIPTFWKGVTMLDEDSKKKDWIYSLRPEAYKIAITLFKEAVKRRVHIVWNGTGKSLSNYQNILNILKSNNYIVETCGVSVKTSTAQDRVKYRTEKFVRSVPVKVIKEARESVYTNFAKLSLESDIARVWDNEIHSPVLIYDNHRGIINRNGWEKWTNPSPINES